MLGRRRKRKEEYSKERIRESARKEMEEKRVFKGEKKGDCKVGEGRERSFPKREYWRVLGRRRKRKQKREYWRVLGRRRKRKDYSRERTMESAGQKKEEKGVFKIETKGECKVGEGKERSIQKRE